VVRRGGIDGQGADSLIHPTINTAAPRFGWLCNAAALRRSVEILIEGWKGWICLGAKIGGRMSAGRGRGIRVRVVIRVGRSLGDRTTIRGRLRGSEER
jgi:hypothetical protein